MFPIIVVSKNKDTQNVYCMDGVTNDWSEARVDPLAALFIQRGGQTGKYQAVGLRATQTKQIRNQRQSNGSGQAADREDYQ